MPYGTWPADDERWADEPVDGTGLINVGTGNGIDGDGLGAAGLSGSLAPDAGDGPLYTEDGQPAPSSPTPSPASSWSARSSAEAIGRRGPRYGERRRRLSPRGINNSHAAGSD